MPNENDANNANNEQSEQVVPVVHAVVPVLVPDKATHVWRQHGPYVFCRACVHEHGHHIGTTQRLVGVTPSGEPIIANLDENGQPLQEG